jgi:hypothetical protein
VRSEPPGGSIEPNPDSLWQDPGLLSSPADLLEESGVELERSPVERILHAGLQQQADVEHEGTGGSSKQTSVDREQSPVLPWRAAESSMRHVGFFE